MNALNIKLLLITVILFTTKIYAFEVNREEIKKFISKKGWIFHSIEYEEDLDNDGIKEIFVRYSQKKGDCRECCGTSLALVKINNNPQMLEVKSSSELAGDLYFVDFNNDKMKDVVETWDFDNGPTGPNRMMVVYLNDDFRLKRVFEDGIWEGLGLGDWKYYDMLGGLSILNDEEEIFNILSKEIKGYDIFYRRPNEIGAYSNFFRDLDNDGIKELVIYIPASAEHCRDLIEVSVFPPIVNIYYWNGREYVESKNKFRWYYKKIKKFYNDAILQLKKKKEEEINNLIEYQRNCFDEEIIRYKEFIQWISSGEGEKNLEQ